MSFRLLLLAALFSTACTAQPQLPSTPAPAATVVQTGAQNLVASNFEVLRGKRVGLIVNHTALVDTTHLIDLVYGADDVTLVALFGPEHGLRGTADAGEKVDDGRDARTGVPVFSLYGRHRSPTPEMLEGIDVLVFDIQDVGARFYTYISTMALAMQAAARHNIEFVVLDRPNPLGGTYVGGFMLEPTHTSFVGQFAIPIAHGMTVGELARMVKGERLMTGLENLNLTVVETSGWTRAMRWEETGMPWVAPSPNIPDIETARLYPGTCFFEGTSASEGRGTRQPFRLLGAPWANGEALATTLSGLNLPGVTFESAAFTPVSIQGMSSSPKLQDQPLQGVRVSVTDPDALDAVAVGIHILHAFYAQAPNKNDFLSRKDFLALLAGTRNLERMLTRGDTPEAIIAAWQNDVAQFRQTRAPYLLYP